MEIQNRIAEEAAVRDAIVRHKSTPGGLLPLLHELQDNLGYIPPHATPDIAQAFNLSRAEVHGVVTYYHHFRETAPARHNLAVCQGEACQSRGCQRVTDKARALLGCELDETRADQQWHLEATYCLGLCASGPAIQIDGRPYGRMTAERLESLVAAKERT